MDSNNVSRLVCVILCFFMVIKSYSQYATIVDVGGIDNQKIKERIEENTGKLLSELNSAFAKRTVPVLTEIEMTADARSAILALWETSPFRCRETEIVDDMLKLQAGGMELRNIPLFMKDADTTEQNQEGVFVYTNIGEIDNLYLAIEKKQWRQVMQEGDTITELRRREIILGFIENFRTAYNRKDINMLEKVFSDDALIITGKVVEVYKTDVGTGIKIPSKIVKYSKLSKAEYIAGLKKKFASNSYINIKFDEIEVVRHKKKTNYYGVNLTQYWNTSNYKDVGYLFLLIDFSNEDNPIIHVRTWQPKFIDGVLIQDFEKIDLGSTGL